MKKNSEHLSGVVFSFNSGLELASYVVVSGLQVRCDCRTFYTHTDSSMNLSLYDTFRFTIVKGIRS